MNDPIDTCLRTLEQENGPFVLSQSAGCATPDTPTSEGSQFLIRVRDDVVEGLEYALSSHLAEADVRELGIASIMDDIEEWFDSGGREIADGAPSIYTFNRWREFVDLAAWQEEPEITGEWPDDLTNAAGLALYQIADRLVHALKSEFEELVRCAIEEAQEEAEEDS